MDKVMVSCPNLKPIEFLGVEVIYMMLRAGNVPPSRTKL